MNSPEQNFAKDLSNISAIVSWAADQQLHGSFSGRRPDLGRMFRCPHCRQRRRMGQPRCCNPRFATTKRAWTPELGFHQDECPERSNEKPFSKAFMKKLRAKHHGQSKNFHLRHQAFLFHSDPELLKAAAKEMHVAVPEVAHIASFAEKYWLWKRERQDRAERRRQSESRRQQR